MRALYSSLFRMAFSSVAWPAGVGVAVGVLVGGGLAYLLVDRVLRAQGAAPRRGPTRRFAAVCCVAWGLVLPLGLAAAGLVWGMGSGVATVVEGPVSATVRETVHATVTAANGVTATVARRLPLGKRLTEREVLTFMEAAPQWLAAVLDEERLASSWQKATGVPMPAWLASVLRHEVAALASKQPAWLRALGERLRAQARATPGRLPTVQQAIEATVAPAVFEDIAASIRSATRRDATLLALGALLLSALLAGGLLLAWRHTDVARRSASPGTASSSDLPPSRSDEAAHD